MYILGLGGSGHDFSDCLCNDTGILGYIEDERITRIKHSFILGNEKKISEMSSVWYLLNQYNLGISDISRIYTNDLLNAVFYRNHISDCEIQKIRHHLAHAASTYYPSEFQESAILVVDGAGGEWKNEQCETISFWYGKDKRIQNVKTFGGKAVSFNTYFDLSMPFTNSIGGFYRVVTNLLGFGLFDEGKIMGLASYGTDRYWPLFLPLFDISDEGAFVFNEESFRKLINISYSVKTFQDKADFAFSAQKVTSIAVVSAAKALKKITNCNNVCIAGGVALNSVANYAIYTNNIYKNFFIQPASGDAGTAIGAALYGLYYGQKD